MANPKFNDTALTTHAARCRMGQPQVRAYLDTLPGVNGAFAQLYGTGARRFFVSGMYIGTVKATTYAAMQDLLASIDARQDLADGSTIASFVDCASGVHTNCILMSYNHGPIQMTKPTSDYQALCRVTAQIIQLVP